MWPVPRTAWINRGQPWDVYCLVVSVLTGNKQPQQLMLVETVKKCRGGKGWIMWKKWLLPNYLKEQDLPQSSRGTGINHPGAVTKYLGGRKGLPENWKTIKWLSSDEWQIWQHRTVLGGLILLCAERNRNCSFSASGNLSANSSCPSTSPTNVKQKSWALKQVWWGFPNTTGFGNLSRFCCLEGYAWILHYFNFLEVCYINSHCQLMFSLTSKALTMCICFKLILIAVP